MDIWTQPLSTVLKQRGQNRFPLLAIQSEEWLGYKTHQTLKTMMRKKVHQHAQLMGIVGSKHTNYNDFPLFSPRVVRGMGKIGPVDVNACLEVTAALHIGYLHKLFNLSAVTDTYAMHLENLLDKAHKPSNDRHKFVFEDLRLNEDDVLVGRKKQRRHGHVALS
jgi:hypothetical protein